MCRFQDRKDKLNLPLSRIRNGPQTTSKLCNRSSLNSRANTLAPNNSSERRKTKRCATLQMAFNPIVELGRCEIALNWIQNTNMLLDIHRSLSKRQWFMINVEELKYSSELVASQEKRKLTRIHRVNFWFFFFSFTFHVNKTFPRPNFHAEYLIHLKISIFSLL